MQCVEWHGVLMSNDHGPPCLIATFDTITDNFNECELSALDDKHFHHFCKFPN